jgi:hypothetical protein
MTLDEAKDKVKEAMRTGPGEAVRLALNQYREIKNKQIDELNARVREAEEIFKAPILGQMNL